MQRWRPWRNLDRSARHWLNLDERATAQQRWDVCFNLWAVCSSRLMKPRRLKEKTARSNPIAVPASGGRPTAG